MGHLNFRLSPSTHVLTTGSHKDIQHQWALLHTMKRITVDKRTIKLMANYQAQNIADLLEGELEFSTGIDSTGKMYDRMTITYNKRDKDS